MSLQLKSLKTYPILYPIKSQVIVVCVFHVEHFTSLSQDGERSRVRLILKFNELLIKTKQKEQCTCENIGVPRGGILLIGGRIVGLKIGEIVGF